jgi:PIN domain nuclease of toxin-antitoxin system
MMLLDTHTLVWLDEGNSRLGRQALSLIDQSLQSKELFVSSISFWEVAMLVEKSRLEMHMSVALWRQNLIENGLQEIALSGNIAIQSAILKDFYGDPADRMIVATAIESTMTLCTADTKILSWDQNLLHCDARI